MRSDTIHIVITEDQHLFRQAIVAQLSTIKNFKVVFEALNGTLMLDYLAGAMIRPDIVLLDLSLPDTNGTVLCEILVKEYPDIRIIILSVYQQDRLIAKMIHSGASAYLNKNCDFSELVQAIHAVHTHGFYINAQTFGALRNNPQSYVSDFRSENQLLIDITPREIEVLKLISQEFSSAEIAGKLFISERTVEGHRNRLLLKTGSKNVAGLVLFAVRHHLIHIL